MGAMPTLDGRWKVERTGRLLPPLLGVTKEISANRGRTFVGRVVGVPFEVEGLRIHYVAPFSGFVDVLEPEGNGYSGRATFRGRELGRFRMLRVKDG
jgi:hypothetical protein